MLHSVQPSTCGSLQERAAASLHRGDGGGGGRRAAGGGRRAQGTFDAIDEEEVIEELTTRATSVTERRFTQTFLGAL